MNVLLLFPTHHRDVEGTLSLALLLSTVAVLPAACVLGFDRLAWQRAFLHFELHNYGEMSCVIPAIVSLMGAWVGAFALPLDWERWWQVLHMVQVCYSCHLGLAVAVYVWRHWRICGWITCNCYICVLAKMMHLLHWSVTVLNWFRRQLRKNSSMFFTYPHSSSIAPPAD